MSLVVKEKEGGTYTPHPEGQFAARCIDVVDLGWKETKWGPKYKLRLVFFCGETERKEIGGEQKNVPLLVMEQFTASLHQDANLRKFCRSWRGRDFGPDELKGGFDFEKMLNAPAFLQIEHNTTDSRTYANIATVMKLPKGMEAPTAPEDYVRVKDREGWQGPAPHPDLSAPDPQEQSSYSPSSEPDDDLPF